MITAGDALAAMAKFPLQHPADVFRDGTVLILAPHPDDESLGCGGLIAAAAEAGHPPYILVLTDGAGSHPNSRSYPPARLRRVRREETVAAAAELGLTADRLGFLGLPDTESPVAGPAFGAAVTAVASLAMRLDAQAILASWVFDPHCDHESAHLIAAAAAREAALPHLAYPVWGLAIPDDTSLPGPPPVGRRIDISAWLPRKRRAIAAHRSQYAGIITDDPCGFQMTPGFMALFDRPYEVIIDVG